LVCLSRPPAVPAVVGEVSERSSRDARDMQRRERRVAARWLPAPDRDAPLSERGVPARSGGACRCTRRRIPEKKNEHPEGIRSVPGSPVDIFQSPEVAFRIRVVVGNMRTTVGFGDPQIRHQESNRYKRRSNNRPRSAA